MGLFDKFIDKRQEYNIYGFVGSPGVGKSCVLQQIINEFYEKGVNVWSTRPFQYARKISISDLGNYSFNINGIQGGVLILDELGIDMNNRHYKEIDKDILEFFKLYRHYKLQIYVVSQGIDIDITVRRLINRWYILERKTIDFLWIHLKTNFVGLYEVGNFLEIENGDWKQKYVEGAKVATYNIAKSFKQFNSFEVPVSAVDKELPYWFPLPIVDPEQENISAGSGGFLSNLRNKLKKEGAITPPKYNPFPVKENPEEIDYSKLSREELLDLWRKEQT